MCDPSSEATFLPRGAISASLGFPLHSAEISMSSRFVGRPQAFPDRASRGALFLTSLLILALLSLLAYVVKNFLVIQKLDPAPCSFFFQAEDGIRDRDVTGVQTCALPI